MSEEQAGSCLCAFDSVSLLETLLMSAPVHTNAFAYLLFKYNLLVHDHIRALVAVTTKSRPPSCTELDCPGYSCRESTAAQTWVRIPRRKLGPRRCSSSVMSA